MGRNASHQNAIQKNVSVLQPNLQRFTYKMLVLCRVYNSSEEGLGWGFGFFLVYLFCCIFFKVLYSYFIFKRKLWCSCTFVCPSQVNPDSFWAVDWGLIKKNTWEQFSLTIVIPGIATDGALKMTGKTEVLIKLMEDDAFTTSNSGLMKYHFIRHQENLRAKALKMDNVM